MPLEDYGSDGFFFRNKNNDTVRGGGGMNYCHGTKTNENVKKPRNNLRREHVCEYCT